VDLESFELVVLRRPVDATEYDEPTVDRIQAEHLAYLAALREAGHIVTNGPVLDHPDESVRGLTFFRVGSLEEPAGSPRTTRQCARGGSWST
jgi:hypothetical protein